jgi:four helix bundle protein
MFMNGEKDMRSVKSEKGEKSVKGSAAESFEELHVYQRARELANEVFEITRAAPLAADHSLVDQMRRAATSVMFNIAEGFERGTKTEFIQFLYIAKGSCGEVRAQLQIAVDQKFISLAEHNRLLDLAKLIGGMLSNFIAHLQKTGYQGEKFSRPNRQTAAAQEARLESLRAAQEVNMRSQQSRSNSNLIKN